MISEKDFKNNLDVPNGPIGKKKEIVKFSLIMKLWAPISLWQIGQEN